MNGNPQVCSEPGPICSNCNSDHSNSKNTKHSSAPGTGSKHFSYINSDPHYNLMSGTGSIPILQIRRLRQSELTNLLKPNLLIKGKAALTLQTSPESNTRLLLPLGVLPSLATIYTSTAHHTPAHPMHWAVPGCHTLKMATVPALGTLAVQQGPGGRKYEEQRDPAHLDESSGSGSLLAFGDLLWKNHLFFRH